MEVVKENVITEWLNFYKRLRYKDSDFFLLRTKSIMPKAYKNFKIHPKKKVRKKILALKQKKKIAK